MYTEGMWLDLKTTSSVITRDYQRSIVSYGYARQAALAREALWKLKGVEYKYFLHICVEEDYPYLTKPFNLSNKFLEYGDNQWREAVKIYKECQETGIYPDYGSDVEEIDLPAYLL